MNKVLCSIGEGPHADLLDVSEPSFRRYADVHGYDVDVRREGTDCGRPLSWARVPLVADLLRRYDLVLWIDADAAIVDGSVDIADELGPRDVMGMVRHRTPEGDAIPNGGVWVLRRSRLTALTLRRMWRSTQFTDHKWWENAAVLRLLGYTTEAPVTLGRPTGLYRRTRFLGLEWNSIPADASDAPRIVHFPGRPLDERLALLRAATAGPGR